MLLAQDSCPFGLNLFKKKKKIFFLFCFKVKIVKNFGVKLLWTQDEKACFKVPFKEKLKQLSECKLIFKEIHQSFFSYHLLRIWKIKFTNCHFNSTKGNFSICISQEKGCPRLNPSHKSNMLIIRAHMNITLKTKHVIEQLFPRNLTNFSSCFLIPDTKNSTQNMVVGLLIKIIYGNNSWT